MKNRYALIAVVATAALAAAAQSAQYHPDSGPHKVLAFWDAYLKKDPNAKQYLASDALEKFSEGRARVDRK